MKDLLRKISTDQSRTEGGRETNKQTKNPSKKSINPGAGFLKRSTK